MGLGRRSREKKLEQELEQFKEDLEASELPFYMMNYYGMPAINIPDDEEELSEGEANRESSAE